jgi:hypothetical protein
LRSAIEIFTFTRGDIPVESYTYPEQEKSLTWEKQFIAANDYPKSNAIDLFMTENRFPFGATALLCIKMKDVKRR